MTNKIPPVCLWILKTSPKIVRRLDRENDLIVKVGASERLNISNMRLIVPKGIIVYQSIRNIRNKGEFFFAVKRGGDMNPAYFSVVQKTENGALNYMKNCGQLLNYPWYNHLDSSKLFNTLARGGQRFMLANYHPGIGNHPLSQNP